MNNDADAGEEEPYPNASDMNDHCREHAIGATHRNRITHNHLLVLQSGLSFGPTVRAPQH